MASFIAAATSYATHGRADDPVLHLLFDVRLPARPATSFGRLADQYGARLYPRRAPPGAPRSTARGCSTKTATAIHRDDGAQLRRLRRLRSRTSSRPIIEDGLHRMYEKTRTIYYYITLQNEDYADAADAGRRARKASSRASTSSGTPRRSSGNTFSCSARFIMQQVLKAQEMLAERVRRLRRYLGRDQLPAAPQRGGVVRALARLHPEAPAQVPYLTQVLSGAQGPFIAASDYIKRHGGLRCALHPGPSCRSAPTASG